MLQSLIYAKKQKKKQLKVHQRHPEHAEVKALHGAFSFTFEQFAFSAETNIYG